METRADKMLQQADKIGCKKFVRPKVIIYQFYLIVKNYTMFLFVEMHIIHIHGKYYIRIFKSCDFVTF